MNRQREKLWILSCISSLLVLFYELFQWAIIDVVTPFFTPFLWLLVFGFFFITMVRTVIHLFKNKDWKPAAIHAVTILLLIFFPFTKITLNLDFRMNQQEREQVAKMVEKGELRPNVSGDATLIRLPKQYKQLSKGGGEIVIERKNGKCMVLFFTFRGVLDGFSGFVYSPDDQPPAKHDFAGDFKEIKRMDRNWYWVASY
ncbi:hypothetical protein [Anoxybacteroides tepidamans]|uniref:hypothetical protein n=1 Tax=Anoxybacteroides tepidamans TaxID=265948 RepID=UPI000483A3F1|nr:hypothetical protein [Anoxybacillus tepidamans]